MYKWSVFLLVALACSTEDPVPTVPAQQSIPAQQPIPVQRTDTSSQPIVANESAGTITVAVSYFDNASGKTELEALQKGLAEMLTTDLATSSEITVVERGRLDELLKELSLQKNPYFDQNSVGQLGKGLGATYLVVGSYMVISEQLWIQARVVDVAQGDVAVATRVEGDPNDWSGLYAKMSSTLLEGLVGKLSVVQRKKLGLNNTTSLTAFQSYSRSLDSLDQGNIEESRSEIEQALKEDPNFKAAVAQQNKVEQLSKTFDLNREEESLKVIAGYIAGKDCVSEYELEGGFPADWAQRPAGEKLATRYFIGSGQRHLGSQNYVGPLQIVSAMVRVGMNEEAGALLDDFLSDSFMERSNLRGMASCMGYQFKSLLKYKEANFAEAMEWQVKSTEIPLSDFTMAQWRDQCLSGKQWSMMFGIQGYERPLRELIEQAVKGVGVSQISAERKLANSAAKNARKKIAEEAEKKTCDEVKSAGLGGAECIAMHRCMDAADEARGRAGLHNAYRKLTDPKMCRTMRDNVFKMFPNTHEKFESVRAACE